MFPMWLMAIIIISKRIFSRNKVLQPLSHKKPPMITVDPYSENFIELPTADS